MSKFIVNIPKVVVALLLVAAIVNLLVGVFLRYVMLEVTDWLDVDPIRFTWVEEVSGRPGAQPVARGDRHMAGHPTGTAIS